MAHSREVIDGRVGLALDIDDDAIGVRIMGPAVHNDQGDPLRSEHADVLLVEGAADDDAADLRRARGPVVSQGDARPG